MESIWSHSRIISESMSQTLHAIQDPLHPQSDRSVRVGIAPKDYGPSSFRVGLNTDDISEEIRESLIILEEELELIQQDLEDVPAVSNKQQNLLANNELRDLRCIIDTLSTKLRFMQTSFRKTKLDTKRNIEVARKHSQLDYLTSLNGTADETNFSARNSASLVETASSERELPNYLFISRRRTSHRGAARVNSELILSRSSDLTASLRITHELLTSGVSRSRFAQDTLDASNTALESLNQRYGTLDELLSQSRGLLGTLLRSQKSDTWYLETAVWILIGTIGWLIFRRMLYGPLWWLAYLPFKILCFAATRILPLEHSSRGVGIELASRNRIASISSQCIEGSFDTIVVRVAEASEAMPYYLETDLGPTPTQNTEMPFEDQKLESYD